MKKINIKKFEINRIIKKSENRINALFILVVAIVLVVVVGIMALLAYLFNLTELLTIYLDNDLGWFVIMIWIVSSVVVGLLISYLFGQIIMKPIHRLIYGMTRLSEGHYDEQIDVSANNALKELSESYNKLASELKKNEMLSADFINNFSHELKTPLVSITGLISLMKQPNFPEEKRIEYLNIIEEEAHRLSDLTTNILNLSKLENQEILKDKEAFNLSEQIRTSVLLLDKKWAKKSIDFVMEFDEIEIVGNMDLLKQVWINLIDNAIKFAYNNSIITINVQRKQNYIYVDVINECDDISEEDLDKIFAKFYQGSSKTEGNGIGLSIVKKIVTLHKGDVIVESKNNKTKFTIKLARIS